MSDSHTIQGHGGRGGEGGGGVGFFNGIKTTRKKNRQKSVNQNIVIGTQIS